MTINTKMIKSVLIFVYILKPNEIEKNTETKRFHQSGEYKNYINYLNISPHKINK